MVQYEGIVKYVFRRSDTHYALVAGRAEPRRAKLSSIASHRSMEMFMEIQLAAGPRMELNSECRYRLSVVESKVIRQVGLRRPLGKTVGNSARRITCLGGRTVRAGSTAWIAGRGPAARPAPTAGVATPRARRRTRARGGGRRCGRVAAGGAGSSATLAMGP